MSRACSDKWSPCWQLCINGQHAMFEKLSPNDWFSEISTFATPFETPKPKGERRDWTYCIQECRSALQNQARAKTLLLTLKSKSTVSVFSCSFIPAKGGKAGLQCLYIFHLPLVQCQKKRTYITKRPIYVCFVSRSAQELCRRCWREIMTYTRLTMPTKKPNLSLRTVSWGFSFGTSASCSRNQVWCFSILPNLAVLSDQNSKDLTIPDLY